MEFLHFEIQLMLENVVGTLDILIRYYRRLLRKVEMLLAAKIIVCSHSITES